MTSSETAIEAINKNQTLTFPVGSEVEVSSDEEGFKGAWFRATVIDTKKRKKVRVEYYNLVTEDGSEQLREYVDWAHVRPLPPAVGCLTFGVGDVVDADYKDGWWTGVVKKALGNSKYRVFFDNPPDLIEFHQNQMRVHQDWTNSQWICPKRELQMTGSHFSPGTDVEVNLDEEDSRSAWIPSMVVKDNKDNTFLVKYHNPNPKHWGVTVDFLHIRPPPPCYADRIYKLHEKVDAFCDSAWRPGEITKIIADKTYIVSFKNAMKSKELSRAELRPRVEWRDGKWEIESKEPSVASNSNSQDVLKPGSPNINIANTDSQQEGLGVFDHNLENKPSQSTKTGKEHSNDPNPEPVSRVPSSTMKNTTLPAPARGVRRVHRLEKSQDGVSTESPVAGTPFPGKKGYRSELASEPRTSFSSRIRKPVVPFKFENFTEKKHRSKRQKNGAVEVAKTCPPKRKGRPMKYSVRNPETSAVGDTQNAKTGTTANIFAKTSIKEKAEHPIKITSSAEGIKDLLAKVASQFLTEELETLTVHPMNKSNDDAEPNSMVKKGPCQKKEDVHLNCSKKLEHETLQEDKHQVQVLSAQLASEPILAELLHSLVLFPNVELGQPETGGSSNKRKRGRPRKLVVLGLGASDGVQQQNGTGLVQEMVQTDLTDNEVASPFRGVKTIDLKETGQTKANVSTSKNVINETGTVSVNQSIIANDDDDDDDYDDRPLSAWLSLMQSSAESLGKTASQRNPNKKREADVVIESPATKTSNESTAPEETQRLPFTKTSPIWKVLESMDLFRIMPQNPHFEPLYECKEECREGLAIGNMVTFSSLVDKISKLQIDDRGSIFSSILESLVDLEKHGFDVSALRNRVNELVAIKDKQELLHNKWKDTETKIVEYKGDKTKLVEKITEVAQKIRELQEKHDLIKTQIEGKDNEIALLQNKLDSANQSLDSARLHFEKLRASPMVST